jgi:response regulator RpfG family c-di-GMP phosphodiesterase
MPCKAKINVEHTQAYKLLDKKSARKRERCKESKEAIDRSITALNTTAAAALEERRGSTGSSTGKRSRVSVSTAPSLNFLSPPDSASQLTNPSTIGGTKDIQGYVQLKLHDGPNPS